MGVTKPLLYTYFGNKEQLYLACMEPAAEALTAAVLAAVERAATPADALHGGVHAFFAFVDQERGAWRILFDETLPAGGEVARRVAAHRERLTALIAGRSGRGCRTRRRARRCARGRAARRRRGAGPLVAAHGGHAGGRGRGAARAHARPGSARAITTTSR